MNYKITQINSSSWSIEDEIVRIYLLTGSDCALLIDSGANIKNIREIISTITDLPLKLLNTHADMDHIGANGEFDSFYMHPEEEPNLRNSGNKGTIVPVQNGDVIDLGNRPLKIIHIPGHTPGSIAVLDILGRVLISGDPIQRNSEIFMFGSQRNMDQYIRSLENLTAFCPEFDEIWPAHGDYPITPEIIPVLHDAAVNILSGNVPGTAREVFGTPITAYDVGDAVFLCEKNL